ncbi:MAG: spondin domain-containing protein, partial [Acidimicrobiia bacterium]|nr:spondin domain-containing protein [Acidimicrobiia bacterium]
MRKRLATALAAVALLLAMTATASAEPPVSTYEITITNLTSGQPFTPPLVATHRKSIDLFDVGRPASHEIQQIAENGNLDPAVALATGSSKVFDAQVVLGEVPPLLPGASRTFTVSAVPGAENLTWVSMLICTNDGFTGLDTLGLPKNVGDGSVQYTNGYDAGTEINTETWSDLVPPCAPLTGVGDQGG